MVAAKSKESIDDRLATDGQHCGCTMTQNVALDIYHGLAVQLYGLVKSKRDFTNDQILLPERIFRNVFTQSHRHVCTRARDTGALRTEAKKTQPEGADVKDKVFLATKHVSPHRHGALFQLQS